MFSDKVEQALRRAGWEPNRQIDISPYIEALKKEGYDDIPEVLKAFLSEFGGLYLVEPNDIKDPAIANTVLYKTKDGISFKKPWFESSTPVLYKDLYPNEMLLNFDVIDVIGIEINPNLFPKEKRNIYEPQVKEDIIIFGEVYDGRFELYMTPSGKIYARDGDYITLLGNNYIEMFENVYNKVEFDQIK